MSGKDNIQRGFACLLTLCCAGMFTLGCQAPGTAARGADVRGQTPLTGDLFPQADADAGQDESYTVPQRVNGSIVSVPRRNRESIVDKEENEQKLTEQYTQWQDEQKQKKAEKIPSYLRPLTDDRKVFSDPNSPFARQVRQDNERRFVRQITAADLNMMSNVSSTRELMDWEKEQDLPIDWSKYSAKGLWTKWRDALGMGPDEKEAIALMKQACQKQLAYEETKEVKQLTEAAALYDKAGKKWPESVLEEDALFHAGDCYFFANNYTKALERYRQLATQYTNSILKRDAMLRLYAIGQYWVRCSEEEGVGVNVSDSKKPRFSSFAGAKKAFETIFLNDPSDSGLGADALYALANAYMRRGVVQGDASFESAARYYRQLYEFYPASKYAEKSYQLAMLALHKSYRGPLYDDTPLKQAKEIAEAAKRTGRGDQDLIAEELESIRNEQAVHLWTRGQYYEKQGQYASSRSYYNRLIQEFPNTEVASEAAKRYNDIASKPDETDQFAWIRPVLPILPKSKNQYFEEPPDALVEVAARDAAQKKESDPDEGFTALAEPKNERK
ncbi:MAG: tetratricopeptide repeat protein [Planctomycetia bacterium]|nr:tetratricopeptide repeat protein [Planctomycetia bacterium]